MDYKMRWIITGYAPYLLLCLISFEFENLYNGKIECEKSWIEFEIKKMCVRFTGSIPFTRTTWFMDIMSLEFYAFQKFDKFSDCVQNFHILVLKSFVMCMCFLILRSILFHNISTFFVQGIDPFRFTFVISYVSLIFLWSQSPSWIQNLS